ncbi:MAG TPA: hypothetical protein VLC10_04255 [Patescibacteria group bacterium]|nr:hypothetical protein [Patescibacteria group bacterium]
MARRINPLDTAVDLVCGIALMALWLAFGGAPAAAAMAPFLAVFCCFEAVLGLARGHGIAYSLATAGATGMGMSLAMIGYFLLRVA